MISNYHTLGNVGITCIIYDMFTCESESA